jgi:putative endopeptidase
MRIATVLICATALSAAGVAAENDPKGIEIADMDRSADPCVDFYQYANGGWRAAHPIPASQPRWSRRWEAGENAKDQLRGILEEAAALKDQPTGSVEQLVGDFYGACMDEAAANRVGAKPLAPLMGEIARIRNRADLEATIGRFHAINIPVPFALFGQPDNHDPDSVIAQIYASGLRMPDRDYYLKKEPRFVEARAKYVEHVAATFRLAGREARAAKAAASTVMRMETKLAQNSLDNVALRDPKATDHKTSFTDLQKMTPHFGWKRYFETAGVAPSDVNVAEPRFMAEMDRQLANVPLADWKTYLEWQLLDSASPYLSDAFVEENFAFNGRFLAGAKELKPRWKRCAESADRLLGEALGRKYVEKYFPPQAKARMQELVGNLLAAMKETIEGLDWMSAPTKARALEKLSTFNPKIGYPDRWKDYSRVPIRRDAYWDDVVAGRRFNVEDNLETIGKPADRGRWGITPPTSDAYYNPLWNEIVFPAGILQPPAFSLEASDAVNYGAIGVVIGHEISHGFDDQGAQYDAHGRLNNWWTDEDLQKFRERTACVVKQFDGYFIEPGIHHNGKLVLGESIGDLAGAKIAYRAFQIARRGRPATPSAGGFTPDQEFFIAWGQFRGDAVRPEFARTMIQGDPHPVAKYRVIGPLSNLPEFQKAFSCKAGSAMVRAEGERCEVW